MGNKQKRQISFSLKIITVCRWASMQTSEKGWRNHGDPQAAHWCGPPAVPQVAVELLCARTGPAAVRAQNPQHAVVEVKTVFQVGLARH